MASIRRIRNKDGTTSYQISVLLKIVSLDGSIKQHRKSMTFHPTETAKTKIEKEVKNAALQFEQSVKNGTDYSDGKKVSLQEVICAWDNSILKSKVRSGNITERCREDYLSIVKNYIDNSILCMPVAKIRPLNIEYLIDQMLTNGKSVKTVKNTFICFNQIFKYAYNNGLVPENPCSKVSNIPTLKKRKELHTFSTDEATRFLNEALEVDIPRLYKWKKLQDKALFTLALYGGFRKGELLALRWKDINFDNKTLSITKAIGYNSRDKEYIKDPKTISGFREISLPSQCFKLLSRWKNESREICMKAGEKWKGYRSKDFDNNYVFIRANGERMPISEPLKHFHKIISEYNKSVEDDKKLPDIRLHDLRHSCASYLVASGTDIETVADRLGHSRASFTLDIYAHALEEKDKAAADTLEALLTKDSKAISKS